MAESIEDLRKELEYYKKDPEKKAYFALIRIVNQQVDYLNGFNIKEKIGGKASEDATFVRTQGIWENLPKMISSINDLKAVLRISKQDEESENKQHRTSPESIAESIGNTAGQNM